MNILLTAVGKRVQLIKHLKKTSNVFGTDISMLAPAACFVDGFYIVPKCSEKNYVNELIKICKKESIDMLIPLYEREFELLCEYREEFEKVNTILLLSNKNVIKVCNDKWETYKFFNENEIKTPKSFSIKEKPYDVRFPLIIKPRDGMGSSSVFKIYDNNDLNFFASKVHNPIIQQYVEGTEYTIDVLCDLNSKIISIVPRQRIEVRAGEVTKSKTVKDKKIIDKTFELCTKLKGIGPLTIQCIKDKFDNIYFIEINPRFGGGVPLTFESGADYGKFFNFMKAGKKIEYEIGDFKELTMLRYDEAVYR
ncbi:MULTISPECIES: ATP-grasp domain-containing protein [Clostridium]|uniref:ATP-grasp domain-containing protein n=1 Tax=Clostridium TaxID=1485 RepID=UPI000824B1C5|nr:MULTISPECIES: ATP-grasp domain-containing protein [Clostridium]PJI09840.1 carbamoyl phosphate synthase-like protein [Clostridium sp. CT7]